LLKRLRREWQIEKEGGRRRRSKYGKESVPGCVRFGRRLGGEDGVAFEDYFFEGH
jgi:hypothetical protein